MRHRYPPPWRGVTLYYRLDRAARAQQYKWRSKSWGLKIADLTPHSGPPAYSSTRVYIPITMFECVHHGMPSCCVHTMVRSWSLLSSWPERCVEKTACIARARRGRARLTVYPPRIQIAEIAAPSSQSCDRKSKFGLRHAIKLIELYCMTKSEFWFSMIPPRTRSRNFRSSVPLNSTVFQNTMVRSWTEILAIYLPSASRCHNDVWPTFYLPTTMYQVLAITMVLTETRDMKFIEPGDAIENA